MNSLIEKSKPTWRKLFELCWPMLWQSSLLITALFAIDLLFRRKFQASIRYALWLVVLVKLCVPPTLALPTSPAWWLHKTPPPVVAKSCRVIRSLTTMRRCRKFLNTAAAFVPPSRDDERRLVVHSIRRHQFGVATLAAGALVADHANGASRDSFRTINSISDEAKESWA